MAGVAKLQAQTYRISGKVQGVFYRRHVATLAQETGVCGYAKNLVDGSVKARVCGPPEALKEFAHLLKSTKPPLARIDSVKLVKKTAENSCKPGFQIL